MKVLIIGHSLVIDANRVVWNVLAQNHDVEVDLIVPKKWKSNLIRKLRYKPNEETDNHIHRIFAIKCYLKGSGSFYFFRFLPLFWVLLTNKYDGIYLNQETWSLSLLQLKIIRWFTKNRRARFMLCVAQNIKKKLLYPLSIFERLNTSSVDIILGCNKEIKDVIRWKKIKKPCKYFPLSYDANAYRAIEKNIDSDEIIIGYMGRLSEDKGLKVLVDALERLRKQRVRFRLVVAGTGPLFSYLKQFIYVDYLGAIPHSKAHLFYEKIDLFVLPSQTTRSWKEQFGRVLVEAAASGKPIVGSSSGAIPEVLGKLKMPYVFKEESSLHLSMTIKRCAADIRSGKSQRIIKNALVICDKLFSHHSVASRFYAYLTSNDQYDEI